MAFVMPVLIGAMGLATDVANFYFNYYRVQTAADASVLSGGMCLPSGNGCNGTCGKPSSSSPCAPSETANHYATLPANGVSAGEITATTVGGGGTTITMNVSRTVPYYFAKLVGVPPGTANVNATATAGALGTVNDITSSRSNFFPIGLQVCADPSHSVASCTTAYKPGDTLTFNEAGTEPGNWDPVTFSGTSVSICPTGPDALHPTQGVPAPRPKPTLRKALLTQVTKSNSRRSWRWTAAGLAAFPSGTAQTHDPTTHAL